MTTQEIKKFKEMLLAEKQSLEQQLTGIGKKDSSSAGGWDATTANIEVDVADENELADKMEELEENSEVASQLESQLSEVKEALTKIESGNFGLCEICGEEIEMERLEANPSAKVSIKHAH
ncbi:MAG: TraR/DksA C4-type zinc finger protein [Candidatus Paceibacterota bacterium]|jgi:RNA polymerase-binding transcription factor DksA